MEDVIFNGNALVLYYYVHSLDVFIIESVVTK